MHDLLRGYLETHGYWVLFIWTFLEGEAGLILAGFLAYSGYMHIAGVIFTAFWGAFFGDQFYFYLGRSQGVKLLKILPFIARKFRKGLRLIERYGTFVAFASRYTYGFRIVLPIILGMTTFPSVKFCWLNIASAAAWAIIFSFTGYLFGKCASLLVDDVSHYEHYLMATLASLICSVWIFHLVQAYRRKLPAKNRLKRIKAAGLMINRINSKDAR